MTNFNPKQLDVLKEHYNKALEDGEEIFSLPSNPDTPILVSYAKYLIEYLEGIVKRQTPPSN